MRRKNRQVRFIAERSSTTPTKLTDTAGNPSESYDWIQMDAVRQEWKNEFWLPPVNGIELTLAEITNIETLVRRELYP